MDHDKTDLTPGPAGPGNSDHDAQEGVQDELIPQHKGIRGRPRTMKGLTERVRTGHGNLYVTINYDEEGKPFELFGTLGKAGGCDSAQLEAISRLVSLALRSGIGPQEIVKQLTGITCCPFWDEGRSVKSTPDAIAGVLLRTGEQPEAEKPPPSPVETVRQVTGRQCPECSDYLSFEEGCLKCHGCGWSKC